MVHPKFIGGSWGDYVPTREEAIQAAAEIAFEAIMRIETERAIARLHQENASAAAATAAEGENQIGRN
ncbi:hypothetical protein JVX92_07605 [Microbacterium hominis]|uniref:hypothetical protein n=1 Tax=Microbacterium hominis TaxID=162426 RepID=UPI001966A2E6|nr:hypothetical protein [Microbacterium hominis]QRY39430.1 hypothetical protein JVX92_07605 [Microbacterium hominis]